MFGSGCGATDSQFYEQLFRSFDRQNVGTVQGGQVFGFFLSSGLNKAALGDVWDEATQKQSGGLTMPKFVDAMRLIALAQKGLPHKRANIPANLPLAIAKLKYPIQPPPPSAVAVETAELQSEIDDKKNKENTVLKRAESRREVQRESNALRKENLGITRKNNELEQNTADCVHTIDVLQKEVRKLQKQLADERHARDQLSQLRISHQSLQTQSQQRVQQIVTLQDKSIANNQVLSDLRQKHQHENETNVRKIRDLEASMDALQKENASLRKMWQQISSLEQQLREKAEIAASLQEELAALRAQAAKEENEEEEEEEKEERICALKFRHWLCSIVQYEQYVGAFVECEYNDIRLVTEFDDDMLANEVHVSKKLHRVLILRHCRQFQQLCQDFQHRVNSNATLKQFVALFESNGILTLNDLRTDVKQKTQLARMLNTDDQTLVDEAWQELGALVRQCQQPEQHLQVQVQPVRLQPPVEDHMQLNEGQSTPYHDR